MQRKQFLVKLSEEKGEKFIAYLEKEGYTNVHNISFNDLKVKVLVFDGEKFFGTSVACLAGLADKGIRPISIEEFVAIHKSSLNLTQTI